MVDELINEPWAKDARESIENATNDWNSTHAGLHMSVVWGYRSEDDAHRAKIFEVQEEYVYQNGLLNQDKIDYELFIEDTQNPAMVTKCRIEVSFKAVPRIMQSRRDFYNALEICNTWCVYLQTEPDGRDRRRVNVLDVATDIPTEHLTGRILNDALFRLHFAHEDILKRLPKSQQP